MRADHMAPKAEKKTSRSKSKDKKSAETKKPRAKSKPKAASDMKTWELSEASAFVKLNLPTDYSLLAKIFSEQRLYTKAELQSLTDEQLVHFGAVLGTVTRFRALMGSSASAAAQKPMSYMPLCQTAR